MTGLTDNFDLSQQLAAVEETSFDVLPAGQYSVQCEKAELQSTKLGDGQYIKCELTVVGHEKFNGRKIWQNFNISNPSEKAQQIGLGQLKSFCLSSGVAEANLGKNMPTALVGLICKVKTKIRKSEQYGDSVDITSFSKSELTTGATVAQQPIVGTTGETPIPF